LEKILKDDEVISGTTYYSGVRRGIKSGLKEAISLIDQLKAETKNT